jgi:mono/diheme cytochrome c family protein
MNRKTLLLAGGVAGALALSTLAAAGTPDARVERGRKLVALGGCRDCHTPLVMGPNGPAPDLAHDLAGHPEAMGKLPPAPALPPGPWAFVAAGTMTAWTGPWGVTYTANLTPDAETGLGKWTEEAFIATVRTGKHLGKGRPVLPPMPIASMQVLSDEELKDLFAYLKSLRPIHNRVPSPTPPPVATAAAGGSRALSRSAAPRARGRTRARGRSGRGGWGPAARRGTSPPAGASAG